MCDSALEDGDASEMSAGFSCSCSYLWRNPLQLRSNLLPDSFQAATAGLMRQPFQWVCAKLFNRSPLRTCLALQYSKLWKTLQTCGHNGDKGFKGILSEVLKGLFWKTGYPSDPKHLFLRKKELQIVEFVCIYSSESIYKTFLTNLIILPEHKWLKAKLINRPFVQCVCSINSWNMTGL